MGEKTALQQSTTNDRVSNKICYFHMNLSIYDGIKKTQKKGIQNTTSIVHEFWSFTAVITAHLSHVVYSLILSSWAPTFIFSLPVVFPTER